MSANPIARRSRNSPTLHRARRVARRRSRISRIAGGWNNDWLLSQRLIQDLGVEVVYDEVVDLFQPIFLGENGDGLILREQLAAANRVCSRI